MVAWRGANVSGEPNRRGSGSHAAVISAHASGLLYLSHPTFAAHVGTSRSCQLRTPALQQQRWTGCNDLLDNLVGAGEQRRRHVDAERLGGYKIDDHFESRRLHHWKVGGLLALNDAAGIEADLAIGIGQARSVSHQTTGRDRFPKWIDRGNAVARCQCAQLLALDDEEWIRGDKERIGALLAN